MSEDSLRLRVESCVRFSLEFLSLFIPAFAEEPTRVVGLIFHGSGF